MTTEDITVFPFACYLNVLFTRCGGRTGAGNSLEPEKTDRVIIWIRPFLEIILLFQPLPRFHLTLPAKCFKIVIIQVGGYCCSHSLEILPILILMRSFVFLICFF